MKNELERIRFKNNFHFGKERREPVPPLAKRTRVTRGIRSGILIIRSCVKETRVSIPNINDKQPPLR